MSSPHDTITDIQNENKQLKDKLLAHKIASAILFILLVLTVASHIGLDIRYKEDTNDLARKIDSIYNEKEELEKKLKAYEVDENYLMSIGATRDQAQKIIKASRLHNVDVKS